MGTFLVRRYVRQVVEKICEYTPSTTVSHAQVCDTKLLIICFTDLPPLLQKNIRGHFKISIEEQR